MGKEKSGIQSKKFLQKSSSYREKLNQGKKPSKRIQKDIEEVDSLMFLSDSKDKKKNDELDERIKLLKSELQSLIGNTKSEKCFTSSNDETTGCDLLADKHDYKKPSVTKPSIEHLENHNFKEKDLEPCRKSSPTKFSVKSFSQEEFSQCNNAQSNPSSQKALALEESSGVESCVKSNFFNSSLSENQVEQLLYKSFYLQNFEIYLSSSEENGPEEVQSGKKMNQPKRKSRKPFKKFKKKCNQSKINKYGWSSRKVTKRKRGMVESPFESSVEVVDLRNCSSSFNNTVQEMDEEFVELDITDYDWNEPFDVDDKTEFFSDVEILESPEKKNFDVLEPESETNTTKPVENKQSDVSDRYRDINSKTRWECPICFEPSQGQEVVATQCGHIFCKKCLDSHILKFNKNCPTCRTNLSKKPPILLFNF